MSLNLSYPHPLSGISPEALAVAVQTPAVDPTGTLVSQKTVTALAQDAAITALQLAAGDYLVISSFTVTGNPPASAVVPALVVTYSFDVETGTSTYAVEGVTSQGTSVTSGYSVSQSVEFSTDGQGPVSVASKGGQYSSEWTYYATVSIYKVS
jgi:hypothetical protein